MAHAENPPIVHRDIKLQNILVGYDSAGIRVRVADFGLAKHVNPMTFLLSSRGTISFKPPEAMENLDSTAGDVWALGCVFYLLLTDEHPFPEAQKRGELVKKPYMASYRPPSVFNIRIDENFDEIVTKCLQFQPEDRYQNAEDLARAIQVWKKNARATAKPSIGSLFHTSDKTEAPLMKQSMEDGSWRNELAHAMDLSKSPGSLSQAADILEDLMSRYPALRERHEATIRLWRRGISM